MRKTVTSIMTIITVMTASAQLRVTSSAQVQAGSASSETSSGTISVIGGPIINPDTLATVRIIGDGNYQSGGTIAFGNRRDVAISESKLPLKSFNGEIYGVLQLLGKGGLSYSDGTSRIISYDPTTINLSTGTAYVSFSLPVSAPQYLTVSDSRSKTDIEPLENVGNLLKNIVPVSYRLKGAGGDSNSSAPQKNRSNTANANHQYGFLAQDVREVYPELVYEDSEGNLSLDYTGFIPILVDAVQHLQATVEEQAQIIEALRNPGSETDNGDAETVVASLSQNRPNPFRDTTVINCVIPEQTSDAFLCIYDLNGNQKMRINIADRGEVSITIEGNRLTAGMYIYTLIADGIEIDSKRMILTD